MVITALCSILLADANFLGMFQSKSKDTISISFDKSVRSFKLARLFGRQIGDSLEVASRSVRKTRKRRRRRRVKKNMGKRLVSRTKKLVKRSLQNQRSNRRRIVKRSRPHKRVKIIINRRRLRWRRIPRREIRKMTVHGKRLIKHGHRLVEKGKVREGTNLIKKATKAIRQLDELEKGFRKVADGKKLVKAGRKAEGLKLIHKGRSIQKSLGSTKNIELPGYETMNASGRPKPKKKKNIHSSLPTKKDMLLLHAKYRFAKNLLALGREEKRSGNRKKGRKLVQLANKAINQLKKLDHGYRLIMYGKKLVDEGQKKKGRGLMKHGFKIKMSLGSGQFIRLPGFETMNASRKPSSKGNNKGKNKGRRPRAKGNSRGKNNQGSRSAEKRIIRQKLARNPKKGLANVGKMRKYAIELLKRSNNMKNRGNTKRSRELHRTTLKALRDIQKLENAYRKIARGKKLLKKGKSKRGNELLNDGLKITMSLGAGSYIHLPGFQTMNAFRFAPTSPNVTAPPKPPTSSKKLHLEYTTSYPKTCACRLGSGFNNGVCYHMTDRNYKATTRQCKKEPCKPSYVCVIGVKTGITCIRKKNTHRTVPVGDGVCRKEAFESVGYVAYAS